MTEKHLILPFITKKQEETFPYPAELACAACMAEQQRKKPGFLRDTSEKIVSLAKIYYPFWLVPAENQCILLDGLGAATHKFSFKEPTKTGDFIEELRKNSASHQQFLEALANQTRQIREFTATQNLTFSGVVSDKELLGFFQEYFKSGSLSTENDAEKDTLIPAEINEKTAEETSQAVVNCQRTLQADAKGIQYALGVLNEEVAFHKQAAAFETERLKEKCELETASLKPEVEKKVKKLTLKHDKTMASVLKSNEKKVVAMEKKRETYMHKLQAAEQKKDAVQKRISTSKKKGTSKSAYGAYELKKYDREIDNLKKEVKTISEALEKIRKEGENNAKNVEEEFRNAKALEEGKLAAIITACDAKVKEKNKQIETMTIQAESITTEATNLMGELKRDGDALRQQVEIDWKLDNPNVAVLVHVPIYMIKYLKAKDERYSLISPLTISEDIGVLNGLRKILTLSSEPKLKSLMRQASKKLHEMLTENVTEKMQKDEVFKSKISAICRANNLMDRTEFAEMLNEGLDEVVKRGWLTSEEAQASCRHIMGAEA